MTEAERRELSERARQFALRFDRVAILDNLVARSEALAR